jgi:hypothetical protein
MADSRQKGRASTTNLGGVGRPAVTLGHRGGKCPDSRRPDGSASLLDVLTAEQTANDVYLASYDAQQQYAHALIGLGQATDTWSFVYAVVDQPTR